MTKRVFGFVLLGVIVTAPAVVLLTLAIVNSAALSAAQKYGNGALLYLCWVLVVWFFAAMLNDFTD